MMYREIIRTCSNPAVANAAVASIGGDFARHFADEANRRQLPRGILAANLVRRFAAEADEMDLHGVSAAARNSELPLLSGLRHILESAIEREAQAA